jgi:hypothetical protein
MVFAFTVTPPLSKRFCLPVVLCHATIAAPVGPRSDTRNYSLAIKFLHNFYAPTPTTLARNQILSQLTDHKAAGMTCQSTPGGPM